MKYSLKEQAMAYRMSFEIKTPYTGEATISIYSKEGGSQCMYRESGKKVCTGSTDELFYYIY